MNGTRLPLPGKENIPGLGRELSPEKQDIGFIARSVFGLLHHAQNSSLGDLYDLYIVLALSHQKSEGSAVGATPRGLNLFSISEMTGVPRETVRRRLNRLIEQGFAQVSDERTYVLVRSPPGFDAALANLSNRLRASTPRSSGDCAA